MRRVSKEQRYRLMLLTKKRTLKRFRRSARARPRSKARATAATRTRLAAPKRFEVFNKPCRRRLLDFIENMRTLIVARRRDITIDFTRTEKMFADGALLFLAELKRSLGLAPAVKVRMRPPRNAKVFQVLQQIGICDLLKCRELVEPTDDDVIHWCCASGNMVDGKQYESVLGKFDGQIAQPLQDGLYTGITEAMTNCHHHAYYEPRQDGLNAPIHSKDWWMFSQVRDGVLSVVFCDLGLGIPVTLPRTRPTIWERLITMHKTHSDGTAIEEAIKDAATRTGLKNRGKGLRQLVGAIESNSGGLVRILSNRGCYTSVEQGGRRHASTRDFSDNILGTLIQWQVQLDQAGVEK